MYISYSKKSSMLSGRDVVLYDEAEVNRRCRSCPKRLEEGTLEV